MQSLIWYKLLEFIYYKLRTSQKDSYAESTDKHSLAVNPCPLLKQCNYISVHAYRQAILTTEPSCNGTNTHSSLLNIGAQRDVV